MRFIFPRRENDTNLDSFARSSSPFVESADSWFSGWRYRRRRWRGLPAGVSVTGKVASWAGALTFVPGPLEGVLTLGTAAGASGFAGRQQRWSAGQVSRNIGEVEIIRLLVIMSFFFNVSVFRLSITRKFNDCLLGIIHPHSNLSKNCHSKLSYSCLSEDGCWQWLFPRQIKFAVATCKQITHSHTALGCRSRKRVWKGHYTK